MTGFYGSCSSNRHTEEDTFRMDGIQFKKMLSYESSFDASTTTTIASAYSQYPFRNGNKMNQFRPLHALLRRHYPINPSIRTVQLLSSRYRGTCEIVNSSGMVTSSLISGRPSWNSCVLIVLIIDVFPQWARRYFFSLHRVLPSPRNTVLTWFFILYEG